MIQSQSFISGMLPAIATPFTEDASEIDYSSLERLVSHVFAGGASGVIVAGSTGEAATLGDDEYQALVRRVVALTRNQKGALCIAGIGTSSTSKAVSMAKYLKEVGVDGILLVAPLYNKPPQDGILAHFREVYRASKLPIVAYNVPGRTVVNIAAKTVAKLAQEKLIVALKESSGSLDQIMDIVSLVGDSIALLSGEDSLAHVTMAAGGRGIISVTGNVIPDQISKMVSCYLEGQVKESLKLQIETLPLTRAMFMETNPIPVKAALAIKGVIATPAVRLPLIPAQIETLNRLRELI